MNKLLRAMTTPAPAAERNQLAAVPEQGPAPFTRIFIRDMQVDMLIGIYDHEKQNTQPVVVNLQAEVNIPADWRADEYEHVVCYEDIVNAIKNIAGSGHINLLETLAEHIADYCLQNTQVENVMVRVEKTAVFDCAHSAGVEIRRARS